MIHRAQRTSAPATSRIPAWSGCAALIAALFLAVATPASAQEFIRLGESARGLAMGGALTAVATSFDAMLYNPAGLSQSKVWKVEVSYWGEASVTKDVADGDDFFDSLEVFSGDTAGATSNLQANAVRAQSSRSQTFAGFHNGTGFGIAYIESTRLFSAASPISPPALDLTYDRISGGLITFSFTSDLELLTWGFTFKSLNREASRRILAPADIAATTFRTEFGTQGDSETDFDLGVLMRLPIAFLRPTLGVAMLNGNSPDFGFTTVQPLEREVNIGISFNPDIYREYMNLLITAEQRDTTDSAFPDDLSRVKREHFGAELSLFPQQGENMYWLHLRIGKSQGFDSYGIGFNLSHYAAIDFVSYGEDVGSSGVTIRQRREMLQFKLGF